MGTYANFGGPKVQKHISIIFYFEIYFIPKANLKARRVHNGNVNV